MQAGGTVPRIRNLVDAPALLDAVSAAGLEGPTPWTAISVSWDSAGELDTLFTVATGLSAERAAAVERAVAARLIPQQGAMRTRAAPGGGTEEYSGAWGVLLRLDGGDEPRIRVAWPEECPPAVLNMDHVLRRVGWEIERFSVLGRRALPRAATVLLHVLADGTVEHSTIVSSSTVPEVDAAALRIANEVRYRPSTRDGRPVDEWVELPVIFDRPITVPSRN
jgi:TonB family protein